MNAASVQPARRKLDTYVCKRPQRDVAIRSADVTDVAFLREGARYRIPGQLSRAEHIERVLCRNDECIWVVERRGKNCAGRLKGFHPFLPLTEGGESALFKGTLQFLKPELRHIATPSERPAALYRWASLEVGTTSTATSVIMQRLRARRYRDLDIYARPISLHEARAFRNGGFRPLTDALTDLGSPMARRRLVNRASRLCQMSK